MSTEALSVPYHAVHAPASGDALVFAPHADDEVFGCGGAICAHLAQNNKVAVIVLTDGSGQGPDPKTRYHESEAAGKILGYGVPCFWGLKDRGLLYGEELVQRLRNAVIESKATVIYTPSPWEVHPDHLALSLSTTEAIRRIDGERSLVFYEVGMPLHPNRLVDLTPYLEIKRLAVACFKSQLAVRPYDRQLEGLNRFRAYTLNPEVEAAEAFLALKTSDLQGRGIQSLFALEGLRRGILEQRFNVQLKPLVSVICRTMGREEFEQAAGSVALQTYLNIEFIVVDAAGSGLSLDAWRGRFPQRVVSTGKPLPRAGAGNAGLNAARGQYYLFLDEDDWIDPDHIEKLVDGITANGDYSAVYTDVAIVDRDGVETGLVYDHPFDRFRLVTENTLPIHGVLFERSLVEAGCRMDESLDYFEDWDLWLQVSENTDFLHVDGISAYYRQGGQSGVGGTLDDPEKQQSQRRMAGRVELAKRWLRRKTAAEISGLLFQVRERLITCEEDRTRQIEALKAADAELQTHRSCIERQDAELQKQRSFIERQTDELAALVEQVNALKSCSKHLDLVLGSNSWRLTAPFRWFMGFVRQLN